ncbi:hypothetical protein ACHQM5_008126 [Ranunculus cassubicifolius]
MENILFCILFSITLLLHRELCEAGLSEQNLLQLAETPPRGWNSYDSFSWTISEPEFLQNAEDVSRVLLPHGYQYVVVDYLWYRKKVEGAHQRSIGLDYIDEWGRLVPDPERWPSSKEGEGFAQVSEKVHAMGLKFGIHVMRGLSVQAFNANTPIFDTTKGGAYMESGRKWTARDIGLKDRTCSWAQGFMSINTSLGAGKAFMRSLYRQYADWGVDFVKNDCVFGDDFDANEINVVSEVLKEMDRPILYSLSPGTNATPKLAKEVSNLVNMYRVTGDDWDLWKHVESHFDVARDFAAANMIGAKGLRGKSWPDLDMLPLGWLTDPESSQGPHRMSNLTLDEQRTQMTLWSMAKSPLMFGGDMRKLDNATHRIIAHPILLEINSYSTENKEFPYISGTKEPAAQFPGKANSSHIRSWIANGRRGEMYLSFYNLCSEMMVISTKISDLSKAFPDRSIQKDSCKYTEVWNGKDCRVTNDSISIEVETHGCALFVINCN